MPLHTAFYETSRSGAVVHLHSTHSVALSIVVPPDDDHVYYWRAIAYDRFDLNGWSLPQIMLIYGLAALPHSLTATPCS